MRWWPLLLLIMTGVSADECQREFFAQPVVYDRAMSIDFYYTAINLQSVAHCAAFCGDRHFCRTAVYNAYAKTCAISYEYTLNCRYNEKRVKDFDTSNSSSHLVQIACVTKCNEKENIEKQKILAGEPHEFPTAIPSVLRKVQLITGPPNDGFPRKNLARNSPRTVQDAPQQPGFVNKLVIENLTSGGILPVLDSRHMVRRKGQICYRLREKKYLLGAAYEIHRDVSLATCRCLCAHSYSQNSIFMCKSFNWRADGTCELNKANHMGRYDLIDDTKFIYQFIDCDVQVLMNIGTKFCTKEGLAISSTSPKSTTPAMTTEAPTTPTPTDSTTITITDTTETNTPAETLPPSTELTTATNPQETSTADDTTESSTSLPETTTGELTSIATEETTTEGHDNPITSAEEKAGFFVGTRKEAEEETTTAGEGTTTQEEITTTEERTTREETTPEEETTTEQPTTQETTTIAEETTTETPTLESTFAETPTEPTTTTEVTTSTEELTTTAEVSTSTEELTTTPEIISETTERATTTLPELIIENGTCFERIHEHMMVSGAAALEHDVSLEECACFCANSRESGRHGFDCRSATYYHGERDCVLNLEDRQLKPKDFAHQPGEFNVTYLGMTCTRDTAIAALVKPDRGYGCRAATLQTAKPKTKSARTKGAFTDECFFELPSHVLEGIALHVETNATPQQCKCLCIAAEHKFGEACQSFQYYYEGGVCLLSKNNRYSNPEKFSALQDQQPQSYFEYRCASKEGKLKKYTEQMCLFQKAMDDTTLEKSNISISDDISRPLTALSDKNNTSSEEKITSILEGSGLESNETSIETTTLTTTELTTESTTTPTTTATTTSPSTTKKHRTQRPINRAIPEAEGLDESDFEELEGILSNNLEDPTTAAPVVRANGVKTVKFTKKIEKAVQEDTTSTTVTKPPTTILTTTLRPRTTTRLTTTTSKGPEYPSAGQCTYSALYQTAFFGRRTIKTVHVKTAADCFAACFALHCRSANLIAQGALNQCELFRDSLIDYRRPDMIGYDGSTVYFDGIRCDGI